MSDRKPTSNETTLYLPGRELNLAEIIEKAKAHFADDEPFNFEDYTIEAEEFHARHIGYDLYDPADYDHYIVVSRVW